MKTDDHCPSCTCTEKADGRCADCGKVLLTRAVRCKGCRAERHRLTNKKSMRRARAIWWPTDTGCYMCARGIFPGHLHAA